MARPDVDPTGPARGLAVRLGRERVQHEVGVGIAELGDCRHGAPLARSERERVDGDDPLDLLDDLVGGVDDGRAGARRVVSRPLVLEQ